MSPIRLLIVCDHRMLADVLTERLGREPGAFAVHHRRSVDSDLVEVVRARPPAVVLVDAGSITGHWTALVDRLTAVAPQVRTVVLSGSSDTEHAVAAARRCLAAWLLPDVTADHVVDILRDVAADHTIYPPTVLGAVLRRLADERHHRSAAAGPLAALTPRESDVLGCLVEGRRDHEIAECLDMAANTVRTHTGRILRKLGVHSRLDAVRVARAHGVERTNPSIRVPRLLHEGDVTASE